MTNINEEVKQIQKELTYTSDDTYLFNYKNKEKELDRLIYKLSKYDEAYRGLVEGKYKSCNINKDSIKNKVKKEKGKTNKNSKTIIDEEVEKMNMKTNTKATKTTKATKAVGGKKNMYKCEKFKVEKLGSNKYYDYMKGILFAFVPIFGEFNRYFLNKTYKNYIDFNKNPNFIKDVLLFLLSHYSSVFEIFAVTYVIYCIYNQYDVKNYIVVVIAIIIRVIFSIIIYFDLEKKQTEELKDKIKSKIRKYLHCLNNFLKNSDMNRSSNRQIQIKLKKISDYLKRYELDIKLKYKYYLSLFGICMVLILPKLIYIILSVIHSKEYNWMELTIYWFVIMYASIPYFRLVMSYIDPEESAPYTWFFFHMLEKIMIIIICLVIVMLITQKEPLSSNSIINKILEYVPVKLDFLDVKQKGGNNSRNMINKFKDVFN